MEEYTLYLDESKNSNETCFAVSGIIIKNSNIEQLDTAILEIKQCIWDDAYIKRCSPVLHCVELTTIKNCCWNKKNLLTYVKHFPHYSALIKEDSATIKKIYNNVYSKLCRTLKQIDGTIIGCSIDINKFKYIYGENFRIDSELFYEVAMQETIENYAHFLYMNNGIGSLVYESRNDENSKTNRSPDFKMYNNFCKIKSSNKGITFINQDMMSKTIRYLNIFSKQDDIAGLQLADFIAYNTAAVKSFFDNNKMTEFQNKIADRLYNGSVEINEKDLRSYFGMKYLPYDFEYLKELEKERLKLKKALDSVKNEKNKILEKNKNLANAKNKLIQENEKLKEQIRELSKNRSNYNG
ncbi:MAG: DUF3800 domain-containing protein [Eubacterium sp.]|nr:DUF3800 domain-containing protein [Eubacterium sp.]